MCTPFFNETDGLQYTVNRVHAERFHVRGICLCDECRQQARRQRDQDAKEAEGDAA